MVGAHDEAELAVKEGVVDELPAAALDDAAGVLEVGRDAGADGRDLLHCPQLPDSILRPDDLCQAQPLPSQSQFQAGGREGRLPVKVSTGGRLRLMLGGRTGGIPLTRSVEAGVEGDGEVDDEEEEEEDAKAT